MKSSIEPRLLAQAAWRYSVCIRSAPVEVVITECPLIAIIGAQVGGSRGTLCQASAKTSSRLPSRLRLGCSFLSFSPSPQSETFANYYIPRDREGGAARVHKHSLAPQVSLLLSLWALTVQQGAHTVMPSRGVSVFTKLPYTLFHHLQLVSSALSRLSYALADFPSFIFSVSPDFAHHSCTCMI